MPTAHLAAGRRPRRAARQAPGAALLPPLPPGGLVHTGRGGAHVVDQRGADA